MQSEVARPRRATSDRTAAAGQAAGTASLIDRDASAGSNQVGVCCVAADTVALPPLNAPPDGETRTVHGVSAVVHVTFATPVPATTVLSGPRCSTCTATSHWSPARDHFVVPLMTETVPAGLSDAMRLIASATAVGSVDS